MTPEEAVQHAAQRQHSNQHSSQHSESTRSPARLLDRILAGALGVVILGGGAGGLRISSKLDETLEVRKQIEEQRGMLEALRLTLAEIKAHGEVDDKQTERSSRELENLSHEIVELGKALERDRVRSEEHERRIGALEGGRK